MNKQQKIYHIIMEDIMKIKQYYPEITEFLKGLKILPTDNTMGFIHWKRLNHTLYVSEDALQDNCERTIALLNYSKDFRREREKNKLMI
jgi:hypothetical protein